VVFNGLHEVKLEEAEAAVAKVAAQAGNGGVGTVPVKEDGTKAEDEADGDSSSLPTGFAMLLASAEQVEAKKKKPKAKKGTSKEKSLGRLSQKFIQLFLVGNETITLEEASDKILGKTNLPQAPPDASADEILKIRNANNKMIKTKIRRLYDIANIMASVGLIAKMNSDNQHVGSAPRSRPSFKWIYPLTARQILLGDNGIMCVGGTQEKRNLIEEHFGMVVNGGVSVGSIANLAARPPAAITVNSTMINGTISSTITNAAVTNIPMTIDHATIVATPVISPPAPGAVNGNSTETELAKTAAEAAAAAVENIPTHDVADVSDVAAAAAAEAVAAAEAEAEVIEEHHEQDQDNSVAV